MIYQEEMIEAEKFEAKNNKLQWKERLVCCPVCRVNLLNSELEELHKLNDKNMFLNSLNECNHDTNDFVFISEKMRKLQVDMKILYEKQKKAGGIIDLNEQEIIVLTVSLFWS